MRKLIRPLFAILAMFMTTVAAGKGGDTRSFGPDDLPIRLVIAQQLQARLGVLASGLHREVILCLSGTREGELATALDFYMPEPGRSTAAGATARRCTAGSIALWHNHPTFGLDATRDEGARTARPNPYVDARQLCALSREDVEAARRGRPPFMVVAVDQSTWCWWNMDQIDAFDPVEVVSVAAISGQRSWD